MALSQGDGWDSGAGEYSSSGEYSSAGEYSDIAVGAEGGSDQSYDEQYMVEAPQEGTQIFDLGASEEGGSAECPPGAMCSIVSGPSTCSLWIVDKYGLNRKLSLSVAVNRYSRLEIIPCASGYLRVYENKPYQATSSYDLGYVYSGRKYGLWFFADSQGQHDVWFEVGGERSNTVSFYVGSGSIRIGRGPAPRPTPAPAPSPAPGPGCAVWTGKSEYGLGETATIYYRVDRPCTVVLTVTRPDGSSTIIGPDYVDAGTYFKKGKVSGSAGGRNRVTLQTRDGLTCSDSTSFGVTSLPLFSVAEGSYGTESNSESSYLSEGVAVSDGSEGTGSYNSQASGVGGELSDW